jgi:hypothetical protein
VKANRFVIAAVVLAIIGTLVAAFAPFGSEMGTTVSSDGAVTTSSATVSVFQTDGAWVLVVGSVPVLLAMLPLVVRRKAARVVAAVLLWLCCLVGAFSIGMFFIPAAVAMTIAAARSDPVPLAAT